MDRTTCSPISEVSQTEKDQLLLLCGIPKHQTNKQKTHTHTRLIEKEIRQVLTRVGGGEGDWRKVVGGTNL